MFKCLKKIWMFLSNRCECGGKFVDYGYKDNFCDKCDKRQ